MSLSIGEVKMTGFAQYLPAILDRPTNIENYSETYENNRHHVYSLAFWMTDNEMAAEELMTQTFCRAFAANLQPTTDDIDIALIAELRECMDLGTLTLNCAPCAQVLSVRKNTMRVDLERAVVQLPNAERMIFLMHDVEQYSHSRIARLMGISESASVQGLHQARLRMRELLVK
jgi:RNA polymerase sigma-70 factor (ECF subfamily)